MSVSSILAFVLAGVATKAKSVQVAGRSEDDPAPHAVMKQMARELREARRELDQAREDYNALRRENAAQARALSEPPRGLGQLHPLQQHELALQQAAMAMQAQANHPQAQHNAQQAQLAQYQNYQNQGLGQAMGLLGAQNLIDTELWCNCVPARHGMLLRTK